MPAHAETPQHVRTPFVENWGQVPLETLARQAKDFEGTFWLEGLGERKLIALTFDDGPSRDTPALLDILKKNGVHATFFWLGKSIEANPDIARRALAEGHTLANHSYDHPKLSDMAGEDYWNKQLGKTQAIFQKELGIEPKLMRPPYGFLTDAQVTNLQSRGMKAILWSVDTADWFHTWQHKDDAQASREIREVFLKYIHPEAIVLMHDAGGRGRVPTVKAVEQLIPQLKEQGYSFTTVDRLIGMDTPYFAKKTDPAASAVQAAVQ